MWDQRYRVLKHGEVIIATDECDGCRDGWRDKAIWGPVQRHMVGKTARDPSYPSHTVYRRLKTQQGDTHE